MDSNFGNIMEEDINIKFNNYKLKNVHFKEINIPSFNQFSSNLDAVSSNDTCNFLTKNRNYFTENCDRKIENCGCSNPFFDPAINNNN